LTPNHTSYLDPFALAAALPWRRLRQTYWGGWTEVAFTNPCNRLISRLAQVVPIDPEGAALSSLAFGAAALKQQKSLIWFPEGERSPTGAVQPFKPGIALLLEHFQLPIVPVYMHGTYEALPRGQYWPRLRQITVVFGAPMAAPDLVRQGEGERPHERLAQALRHRVAELGSQTGR
jgi:long-chain acyl-CoA synthetase